MNLQKLLVEGINVISVFDGMSVGQLALKNAGVKVNKYAASEIDRYAIAVTNKNFPNTIQLGTIERWKEWPLYWSQFDLLLAGSPCQGFSVASPGRLNFEDPRSKLFFEFVEILEFMKTQNPKVKFLLENVKMKKEWRDTITKILGVEPVLINSALVSAQNRERYYWANFPISQPEDRGILLKDIIVDGEVDREKSYAIDANYYKGGSSQYLNRQNTEKSRRQAVKYQSSRRLMVEVKTLGHGFVKEDIEINPPKYASLCAQSPHTKHMIRVGTAEDIKGHDYNKRVYSQQGKSPALAAKSGGNLEPKVALDETHYRKLHVVECERLQTVPDGYTEAVDTEGKPVSNTQRYKMLGNGWTAEVITHIFECMMDEV